MPEAGQYWCTNKEIAAAIIKETGIHEGRWMLIMNFSMAAGNFGPDANSVVPGAVLGVTQIGIQRAPKDAPEALVVDAAEVNPPAKSSTKTKPKSK